MTVHYYDMYDECISFKVSFVKTKISDFIFEVITNNKWQFVYSYNIKDFNIELYDNEEPPAIVR